METHEGLGTWIEKAGSDEAHNLAGRGASLHQISHQNELELAVLLSVAKQAGLWAGRQEVLKAHRGERSVDADPLPGATATEDDQKPPWRPTGLSWGFIGPIPQPADNSLLHEDEQFAEELVRLARHQIMY